MTEAITTPVSSGAGMDRRVERPHARRRKLLIRAGAAAATVLAAVALWLLIPGSNSLSVARDAITTGEVVRAPFRDYVPLRAEVAPLHTVFITAVSGGQVAEIFASDGQMVAASAPLARLTNPALELDVASRAAQIAGQLGDISGQRMTVQRNRFDSEQQLAQARNDLMKAQHDLQVKRTLFQKNIVNRAAVAPLEAEVAYRSERVSALEASRGAERASTADQSAHIDDTAGQLRQNLAMVRHSLDALTLRAPVAGRLTAFDLQPGQMLKEGDPVGQIDSVNAWKLVADVDQFYLARAHPGQQGTAEIGGRTYRLTLSKVLPQVAEGRFKVEFGFVGAPPPDLNRGQTLDVRLVLGADRPAIVAPAGGWLDAGGSAAFVLGKDGDEAVRRPITTGRRNPDQVEVTSGLAPGERIVTSPLSTYQPYSTLYIR